MKLFLDFTFFVILLALIHTIVAEGETADSALIDIDNKAEHDNGDLVRKTRQFGFGGLFLGGGFFRPRPFFGGGFYRPRPFFGGGFYRPRPFYGGAFYPPPYYGGFYG